MRGPEPVSNGRSVRRSRTRCTPRGRAPGALRPTDVVGAFFLAGLAFVLAGQVPRPGAMLEHPSGWRIEVTAGDETHVTRLRLHRPETRESSDGE